MESGLNCCYKLHDEDDVLIIHPIQILLGNGAENMQRAMVGKAKIMIKNLKLKPSPYIVENPEYIKNLDEKELYYLENWINKLRQHNFIFFCEGWERSYPCTVIYIMAQKLGKTILYEKEPDQLVNSTYSLQLKHCAPF